jgi:hypothetical protein
MIEKVQNLSGLRAVRWGAALLTPLSAVIAGLAFGIEVAFLVLSAGALCFVIAVLWSSVQSLTGESPLTFEEALSMGAPSAEEEQKRAVLRALKDLEYERSVGKISAEDYQVYSARYRAEAKRLIQAVDESLNPARQKVEDLLRDRLAKSGAAEPAAGHEENEPESQPKAKDTAELPESEQTP